MTSINNLEIARLSPDAADPATRAALEFLGSVVGLMPLDLRFGPLPAEIREQFGDAEYASYGEDGGIIAAASVHGQGSPEAFLSHIGVASSLQGRGIGSRFLAGVERELVLHGTTKVYLSPVIEARRFFVNNGYELTPPELLDLKKPKLFKTLQPEAS